MGSYILILSTIELPRGLSWLWAFVFFVFFCSPHLTPKDKIAINNTGRE